MRDSAVKCEAAVRRDGSFRGPLEGKQGLEAAPKVQLHFIIPRPGRVRKDFPAGFCGRERN